MKSLFSTSTVVVVIVNKLNVVVYCIKILSGVYYGKLLCNVLVSNT